MDQKIGTEVQYLQAKNNKESFRAQTCYASGADEMTKIKAPINLARLDEVHVKVGETSRLECPCFPGY